MVQFVISGFYIIFLPVLVNQYENKNKLFKIEYLKFSVLVVFSTIVLSIGIVWLINPLLEFLGKQEFKNQIDLLYLLLVSLSFLNFSLIPNMLLYITHNEKKLMLITGIIFLINIFLNFFLLKLFGINGAAISLIITYLISFILKSHKGYQVWKKQIELF